MGTQHRIARKVGICGPQGCLNVGAVLDTGASISAIAEPLARRLGIKDTLGRGTMTTASGKVRAYAGTARICLPDPGCGCLAAPVAVVPVKNFGDTQLLVGQDYLEASRAIIDCAGRRARCNARGRRR